MLTNELRVGVKQGEETHKNFKLRLLKVSDLKRINDAEYKNSHPLRWLAQTIMILVETIGDTTLAMNGREYPEIVKNLTTIDVSYLMLAGHVYNLGSDLKGVRTVCPCQRRQEISVDVDLNSLEDEENFPEAGITFRVDLPNGIELKLPNLEDIGMKDKIWKHLEFRLPTLGDLLKHEKSFSVSAKSEFGDKVMSSCLVSAQSEDGTILPESLLRLFIDQMTKNMLAKDLQAISREFNKFPSHRLFFEANCDYCGKDIVTPIDPNFLFTAA